MAATISFGSWDEVGRRKSIWVSVEESLVLFKEVGDRGSMAQAFFSLGFISFGQGDYAAARALMKESLEIFRELDLKWNTAGCLEGLAAVVAAQGEPVRTALPKHLRGHPSHVRAGPDRREERTHG